MAGASAATATSAKPSVAMQVNGASNRFMEVFNG
jgi:hypothetical protein